MRVFNAIAVSATFGLSGTWAQDIPIGGYSGSHTELDRWCGKPYEPGSPNYNPGGQAYPPAPSASPLLYLRTETHHSIYDSSEQHGNFIVDASLSYIHGKPFSRADSKPWSYEWSPYRKLDISIKVQGSDNVLISGQIVINSTRNLLRFDLETLKPQLNPYEVILFATSQEYGREIYSATTDLFYLPAKNSGSTVKIDNMKGGMLVANNVTGYAFEPLLPFGFYTSCSGYLSYSLTNVSAYKDFGFNAINPVCSFTDGDLGYLFDWMDGLNLWYQYDMRGSYLNLSSVAEQIPLVKDRSSLLSWYTADEPDGVQYALNSTRLAYDLLKKEDPYHPTGLVLNCQNYYFEEYTSGTDYIMEDAYPVGIDSTFSKKFNTTCNETYGDCGCDNCVGSLQDVGARLDTFIDYEEWLGLEEKPLWAVLQAFSGEQYWAREPTSEETWVMMILGFNHKAKAMMSWVFPASDNLNKAHGDMAKAVTSLDISKFIVGGDPSSVKVLGQPLLDVAYWSGGKQLMVAVANVHDTSSEETVTIDLPKQVHSIANHVWGSSSWGIDSQGRLIARGVSALATDILIVNC